MSVVRRCITKRCTHVCNKCGNPILKGTVYVRRRTNAHGKSYHRECYVDAHGDPIYV
jgi:hypothetical protein